MSRDMASEGSACSSAELSSDAWVHCARGGPVTDRSEKVSLTGQYASVDEDLTGRENLILVGRLVGLAWGWAREHASELLAGFGLAAAAGRQVRTYSGGMRRSRSAAPASTTCSSP